MNKVHEKDIAEVEAAICREKESGAVEDGTKHVRVRYGIYSMRQEPGRYVVRIRLPSGLVLSDQLDVVAELLDQYGTGPAHFTTRQGIQFAGVSGEKVGDVLRKIEERINTETFPVFVRRKGIPELKASLIDLTEVPSPGEGPEFYRDLDSTRDFKVEAQEGECHA